MNNNNKKYVFKSSESNDEFSYKPTPAQFKFYQICLFVDPHTQKHHIRRSIINEYGKFISIEEKLFSKNQFKKFLKNHRPNEFKTYSTYDMSLIDYPNPGDIMQVQSPLLNNNYEYTGYAKI